MKGCLSRFADQPIKNVAPAAPAAKHCSPVHISYKVNDCEHAP